MIIISCNSKTKNSVDKGSVVADISNVKYDYDLLFALQGIGKDSLEKKKLWSKSSRVTIHPDNYVETLTLLKNDISVRLSNDTIFIKDCQSSTDDKGNITLEGSCYEVIISGKDYKFIDESWSDVIIANRENKIEYSPFYLNKNKYRVGDTLIGCFTIKDIESIDKQVTLTTFHKYVINTIVTK